MFRKKDFTPIRIKSESLIPDGLLFDTVPPQERECRRDGVVAKALTLQLAELGLIPYSCHNKGFKNGMPSFLLDAQHERDSVCTKSRQVHSYSWVRHFMGDLGFYVATVVVGPSSLFVVVTQSDKRLGTEHKLVGMIK